ncbi:hypothetical protein B7P43_G15214 [Cryptotermes secundus]|uniref:CCHC-type domain-containing protein n=1 Tax=Cryptotermes secundus TaxID=105785 RepID=A0A2J7QX01_9NEOP|nr:hypothetical protein B7P43_G15214 [Cryptotermes secundus]
MCCWGKCTCGKGLDPRDTTLFNVLLVHVVASTSPTALQDSDVFALALVKLLEIAKVNDEETQRVINEQAERRLLAAYIHGLRCVVGQQVRYQMPNTMDQAVKLAVTFENVEKHRRLRESPRNIFAARQNARCYRCAKPGHYARECRQAADHALPGWRTRSGPRGNGRYGPPHTHLATRGDRSGGGPRGREIRRPTRPWFPYDECRPSEIQCHKCREFGHRCRECPRVPRANPPPNVHGSALTLLTRRRRREDRSIANGRCRVRAPVGNRDRWENSPNVS